MGWYDIGIWTDPDQTTEEAKADTFRALQGMLDGTALQQVSALLTGMGSLDYFRWNIFGMPLCMAILIDIGAAFPSRGPEYPDPQSYFLDEEVAYSARSEELDVWPRVAQEPEKQPAYAAWLAAMDEWLVGAVGAPGTMPVGLPLHKFCSNDGWHVTEEECRQAASAILTIPLDRLLAVSAGYTPGYADDMANRVREFGLFLLYCSSHEGCRVD